MNDECLREQMDAERRDRQAGLKAAREILHKCGDPSKEAILLAVRRNYLLLDRDGFLFDIQREQIELDTVEIDRKIQANDRVMERCLGRAKEGTNPAAQHSAMARYWTASDRRERLWEEREALTQKLFRLWDERDAARQRRTA